VPGPRLALRLRQRRAGRTRRSTRQTGAPRGALPGLGGGCPRGGPRRARSGTRGAPGARGPRRASCSPSPSPSASTCATKGDAAREGPPGTARPAAVRQRAVDRHRAGPPHLRGLGAPLRAAVSVSPRSTPGGRGLRPRDQRRGLARAAGGLPSDGQRRAGADRDRRRRCLRGRGRLLAPATAPVDGGAGEPSPESVLSDAAACRGAAAEPLAQGRQGGSQRRDRTGPDALHGRRDDQPRLRHRHEHHRERRGDPSAPLAAVPRRGPTFAFAVPGVT
jgi:hypothetical protein